MRLDLLVNDFTWRAFTDRAVVIFEGHFKRNFIDMRDVVKGFEHALANFEKMKGQAYNLGLSSANLSKLELCLSGSAPHLPNIRLYRSAHRRRPRQEGLLVSNEKLERTGWTPDWSLDDGIRELIGGFQMIRNSRYANV